MSRRHSRSPRPTSPGDPGPSSLSSMMMAGPSKRKRSTSREGPAPRTGGRKPGDTAASPRRRGKAEDRGGLAVTHSAAGEWTYHLEIVQQPQRARACGFGDKDRRPLSPPPILRLWVRDSAGNPVDPNLVSIHFLVLMVDLWSADEARHKNVVMHPSSQGSSRADSPTRTMSEQTSRPGTGQSSVLGWPGTSYRMTSTGQYPSVLSPLLSPRAASSSQFGAGPPTWQHPGGHGHGHAAAPARPATMRGRSFTRPIMTHMDPSRPTTAPSPHDVLPPPPKRPVSPSDRSTYTLPPISSITLRDRDEPPPPSRMTLPAMHDRPPTRDTRSSSSSHIVSHDYYPFGRPTSSSSQGPWYASSVTHKDSVSSAASEILTPMRESGPPFDRPLTGTGMDRPMTGYGSDRPPSSSYDMGPGRPFPFDAGFAGDKPAWDRPTTAAGGGGGHVSFDPYSRGDRGDPRGIYLSPSQQPQHRLSNASSAAAPPNYSRVLVGSLCAVCQRLQDDDGHTGLFFFAHDLGIRTEGSFTLKFTLTDLTSLMRQSAIPGERVSVLAETYSNPFTVYSAKRFPGVIPTTEMTRHFAQQGVRLPTRQKRTAAGDSDNEGDD